LLASDRWITVRAVEPQSEIDELKVQLAALTARIYQLELRAGTEPGAHPPAVPASAQTAPPIPSAPVAQPVYQQAISSTHPHEPVIRPATSPIRYGPTSEDAASLEKKIGQSWLNRIGVIAMLIGVSYFLKYAFDNDWIGPGGRVAIGLLAGIGLVIWSERLRAAGHKAFSYSMKAVGIGTLYLSLWGAYQVYNLVPSGVAFGAMIVVTAATIVLSLTQDAELLASFALIGGFATPVLLSTGQNHEIVLFSYICLLDLAILALAIVKPWRRLLWGSFIGTILMYLGGNTQYYSDDQRAITVLFVLLFAAIFAAVPIVTKHVHSTHVPGPSLTLTALPLLNAGACFMALFDMYNNDHAALTWYALILASAYLGISNLAGRRSQDSDTRYINMLHISIAIVFITIAIPLKLTAEWITIGWLVESAVLLWVSVKMKVNFLRYLAIIALILGIIRLVMFDQFQTQTIFFNARFATYLLAIGVLAMIVKYGERNATAAEKPFIAFASVALNVMALIALTREAADYFARQLAASYQAANWTRCTQLGIAWVFSYSAIGLIYGAALMAIGLWKRSAFIRWQALALIAVTIAKVFVYDVSALQKGYRILSFIGLGALLLAISFIYQRDWLKLSPRSAQEPAEKTS